MATDRFGVTLPSGTFTAEQFARLDRPPCPVCGAPIDFERVDVTTSWHFEKTGEHQYIVGPWRCPHDCDPVKGERRHYSQSLIAGSTPDGPTFRCSCGFEEDGVSGERIDELCAEHDMRAN